MLAFMTCKIITFLSPTFTYLGFFGLYGFWDFRVFTFQFFRFDGFQVLGFPRFGFLIGFRVRFCEFQFNGLLVFQWLLDFCCHRIFGPRSKSKIPSPDQNSKFHPRGKIQNVHFITKKSKCTQKTKNWIPTNEKSSKVERKVFQKRKFR